MWCTILLTFNLYHQMGAITFATCGMGTSACRFVPSGSRYLFCSRRVT